MEIIPFVFNNSFDFQIQIFRIARWLILTKTTPGNYFDLASFLLSLLLKQKENSTEPTKIELILNFWLKFLLNVRLNVWPTTTTLEIKYLKKYLAVNRIVNKKQPCHS